jgi:beta-glucanase (GH16 family)
MAYYVKHRYFGRVAAPLLLFFLVVTARPGAGQTRKELNRKSTDTLPPGWTLKFQEEFEAASIDYAKWSPHAPGQVVFEGKQTWIPQAIGLADGQAHLTARRTAAGYTSGILTTLGSFAQTFGRFEMRFRMPAGAGLEPIFRLLPLPTGDQPSIDVLDASGGNPAKSLFANRWEQDNLERDYSGSWDGPDLSKSFHTIAVEWDDEKIVWLVDGVERFRSLDGIPQQKMYLAVCLEVRDPDERTPFPASLDIDYIRVFARP